MTDNESWVWLALDRALACKLAQAGTTAQASFALQEKKIRHGSTSLDMSLNPIKVYRPDIYIRSLIHKAHLRIWRKFWKYTQFYYIKLKFLFLNAKPVLQL